MEEISESFKKLTQMMQQTGISKETAMLIAHHIKTEEEIEHMLNYIDKWQDIITDHQLAQHLWKMISWRNKE